MHKENEEKENNQSNIIMDNKKTIIVFICGVVITGIVCGIMWPSRIAKLSDGSEAVASVNGISISADALYKELSNRGGLSTLLELIDEEILLSKYNLESEAAEYAETESAELYQQWESMYGYTKEQALSNYGFSNEDDFIHYLKNDFYKNKYYDDYLNSKVNDEDIQKYYDDVVNGERRAFVFYSATNSKNFSKVSKALKKGTDAESLADKYSDLTYRDLGNVNFNSYNIYSEKFLTELNKLKKGEVSSVIEDENFGYVIIYVTDIKDKEPLDDIKDQIRSKLAQDLNSEDQNLYYRAFQELRKEYNLEIHDSVLLDLYEDFIKQTK